VTGKVPVGVSMCMCTYDIDIGSMLRVGRGDVTSGVFYPFVHLPLAIIAYPTYLTYLQPTYDIRVESRVYEVAAPNVMFSLSLCVFISLQIRHLRIGNKGLIRLVIYPGSDVSYYIVRYCL